MPDKIDNPVVKKGLLFHLGRTPGCDKPTERMVYLVSGGLIRLHDGEHTHMVQECPERPLLLLVEIKGAPPLAGLISTFATDAEREDRIAQVESDGDCYWVGDLNQTEVVS